MAEDVESLLTFDVDFVSLFIAWRLIKIEHRLFYFREFSISSQVSRINVLLMLSLANAYTPCMDYKSYSIRIFSVIFTRTFRTSFKSNAAEEK